MRTTYELDKAWHDCGSLFRRGTHLRLKGLDGTYAFHRVRALLDRTLFDDDCGPDAISVVELETGEFALLYEVGRDTSVEVCGSLLDLGHHLLNNNYLVHTDYYCLYNLGLLRFVDEVEPSQLDELRQFEDRCLPASYG